MGFSVGAWQRGAHQRRPLRHLRRPLPEPDRAMGLGYWSLNDCGRMGPRSESMATRQVPGLLFSDTLGGGPGPP